MKILLIGIAKPKIQAVPYETTMLYEWLEEIGIDKNSAQTIFEFEAVTNEILPKSNPSQESMQKHFDAVLGQKIKDSKVVIILGSKSMNFLKKYIPNYKKQHFLSTIHPSRRNIGKYIKDAIPLNT